MKTFGKYKSFADVQAVLKSVKNYDGVRDQAKRQGKGWVVPKTFFYITFDKKDKVSKQWDGTLKHLVEVYEQAKKQHCQTFGLAGHFEVSINAHAYKLGKFKNVGSWSVELYNISEGEVERLKGNDAVYEKITDRLLKMIEEGVIPWQRPWDAPSGSGVLAPMNFATKKHYRGANYFMLMAYMHEIPFYVTAKQAVEMGGVIVEGSPRYEIVFYNWRYYYVDGNGNYISVQVKKGKKGETILIDEKGNVLQGADRNKVKKSASLRYYYVYNVADVKGIEKKVAEYWEGLKANAPKEKQVDRIKVAEEVVKNMPDRPKIQEKKQGQAYYTPATDVVTMPMISQFKNADSFYGTLFHELGHSTGHASRLNRKGINEFGRWGDTNYAQEELVAELCASYVSAQIGINPEWDNSASYLKGWWSKLNEDKGMFIRAAAQAQKAADFILNQRVVIDEEKFANK